MKNIVFLILISVMEISCSTPTYKTGDIIFHTSKSQQSEMLQMVTKSDLTHVGVIVYKENIPYVFEAVQPVKLTPLTTFIKRGVGSKYIVMRNKKPLTSPELELMNKYGEKQVGKSYDIKFQWGDKYIYCSELVWKIYDSAGIKLCDLRSFNDFEISDPSTKQVITDRYGDSFDPNELVVAPIDLYKSNKLKKIYSNY